MINKGLCVYCFLNFQILKIISEEILFGSPAIIANGAFWFKIFNIFNNMLHNSNNMFKKRENVADIEEGNLLSPKFDNDGLIPVVTTCVSTKEILMHGYMNVEALKLTIETKEAHYWSRSRKQIWHKGKTSGFVQKVLEIRIDDDQDSIWLSVDIGDGSSCHVGYRSCFYRSIPLGKINNARQIEMNFEEKEKKCTR
jgi:phosphoribosyl-AMP cyclohydrolase